jgi:serine/threonine protein kinase
LNDFAASAFSSLLSARQRAEMMSGASLGRWKLDQIISSGGFSVVYRASHPELGEGAVKVLAFDLALQAGICTLFHREIRILKTLTDDPAVQFVPRIYDAEINNGRGLAWIAMQYIEGETLGAWLKSRMTSAIQLTDILEILRGVLTALGAVENAYRAGMNRSPPRNEDSNSPEQCIVHGDIKPSNILIHKGKNRLSAWLLDFGVARIYKPFERDLHRQTSSILTVENKPLTVDYASPEMLVPRPSLDQRSDVFQVGLVAYEMITGHSYWQTWPHAEADLTMSNCPEWLKSVLCKALDWNRDRRFRDATGFLHALDVYARSNMPRPRLDQHSRQ